MENHQTINLSRESHDHNNRRIDTLSVGHKKLEKDMDFSTRFKSYNYTYDEGMEVSYMSNLDDKMANVLIDTDTLKKDVSEIKSDFTSFRNDVTEVKNNVSSIKTEVSNLQSTVETQLGSMNTKVNNVKTEVSTDLRSINTNVADIDKTMSSILDEKFSAYEGKFDKSVSKIHWSTGLAALGIIVAIVATGWIF